MKTHLMDLRWGRFNLIESDMISNIAAYCGEWANVEIAIFHKLLSPHANIVEVGANIGLHTVPLAKAVPHGKVIAFEPQRIIYQQLCCNLALNDITNVYSHRLGVSDECDSIQIETCDYSAEWNYGSFSLDKGFSTEETFTHSTTQEQIDIVNLDSFAQIAELNSLELLKIDAEGFDAKVLNGAVQTIHRLQPIIFVEYQPQSANDLLDFFAQHNYQAFWLASNRYQENNYYQAPPENMGADINFLAIPHSRLQNTEQRAKLNEILQILSPVKYDNGILECRLKLIKTFG